VSDVRLDLVPEIEVLAHAIAATAVGLYVGGSVASRDYRPGVGDIDAVALLETPPSPDTREQLVAIHTRLVKEHRTAVTLHCVYVPLTIAAEPQRAHWTWAFGELFRRRLSRIARADLLTDPVVVFGPEPKSWLPPISDAELKDAARAELAGYWTRALRKRAIWRQDVYVDLGLTAWARAEATITDGNLITKSEAIARMRDRGVLPEVVDGLARRRAGEHVTLSDQQCDARAETVRRFLKAEFARLLNTPV
jgi:hypothetical protein